MRAFALRRPSLLILASMAALLSLACGSESASITGGTDVGFVGNDGRPGDGGPVQKVLLFTTEKGDDGAACDTRCSFVLSYTEVRKLQVLYLENGAPRAGVPITFTVTKGQKDVITLSALSTNTGDDGKASMQAQAATKIGQVEVRVEIKGDGDVRPLFFDLGVSPKGVTPLSVLLQYNGKRSLDTTDVVLFKQASAGGAPKCSDLDVYKLPTATVSKNETKPLPFSVNFLTIPGLDKESPQYFTVVARGFALNGSTPLAWKCEDGSGDANKVKVRIDAGNSLTMILDDLPPRLVGTYEMDNFFDLVSALPPNIGGPLNTVLDFFQDPAGTLLKLTCDLTGTSLEDFCGYVFKDPANPCVNDTSCFTTIGTVALSIVNKAIEGLVKDNFGTDVFNVGNDVRMLLTELNLQSTVEFKAEPGADGTFPETATKESWHTLRYRWTLGKDCPLDDDTCGWRSYSLAAVLGSDPNVLVGQFSGKLESFTDLTIDRHSVNVKYGKLANFVIERVVLPLLSPQKCPIDNYEDFVANLLGGECCFTEGLKSCCTAFSKSVSDSGTFQSVADAACNSLIPLAGKFLRDQLVGLDVDSGDSFTIATKTPCKIFDSDNDTFIDQFGKKTEMCVWDTQVKFGSGNPVSIDADFYGKRTQ